MSILGALKVKLLVIFTPNMKKRSPQYPQYILPEIKTFTVNVYEKTGDSTPLKHEDLAKFGQIPKREADTYAVTAKLYGWMASERGKGYHPLGSVCQILRKPQGNEEKQAYLAAFTHSDIYRLIIANYQGKEIPIDGLEIYLIRNLGFSDSGAKQGAKIFIENAKFLGLINNEGIFNSQGEITITPPDEKEKRSRKVSNESHVSAKTVKPSPPQPNTESSGTTQGGKTIMILIKGQEYNWPVPNNMNSTDWDQLLKQIQQLKQFAT